MLGLRALPAPNLHPKSKPNSPILLLQIPNFPSNFSLNPQKRRQILALAQNGNNGDKLPENGGANEEDGKLKNGRPRLNLRWVDLVLDPDPDNIVAVGLTGLLAWASVQVLWQLFVVTAAILIAALKYTLVAALLIFILITLL